MTFLLMLCLLQRDNRLCFARSFFPSPFPLLFLSLFFFYRCFRSFSSKTMNFSLVRAKQARVTDVALIHRKGCSARRENHISDVSVIAFISAARDWQRRHNQFFRRVQGNIATRCKIDFLTPDSTTRPVAISRLDLFKMFDYSWITATQLIPRLYIYEIRFPFASTFFLCFYLCSMLWKFSWFLSWVAEIRWSDSRRDVSFLG